MSEVLQFIEKAIHDQQCQRILLSHRRQNLEEIPERISIRPFKQKQEIKYQWAKRVGRQELHENLSAKQTITQLKKVIGKDYLQVHLTTESQEYEFRQDKKGDWKQQVKEIKAQPLVITDHNQAKNYLIPEGKPCPFLAEIGVMNAQGKVLQAKYAKFRQINRFLELVQDVLPHINDADPLRVVDYGCGKSYLTFALHHLLKDLHHKQVQMIGLDVREDVVQECERVQTKLGLEQLTFKTTSIADYKPRTRIDLSVSLHACDTATDDALMQAVDWDSTVILAVPCCQHEFLHQKLYNSELAGLHQHGILQERFCALATDAYRAMALEAMGYQTQIIEFIDMEHTPKNIMLRGVKRKVFPSDYQRARFAMFQEFRQFIGIPHNKLGMFVVERQKKKL